MSDELLVTYCSPTLAGIKTGSLFLVKFDHVEDMRRNVRQLNLRLRKKGICILPVRYADGKALLYLYRPKSLHKDFQDQEVVQLLSELGYSDLSPNRCILQLIQRLQNYRVFPHEIGLFLSYPPEDVRGFIENKASNFKMIGTWKVYGNLEKAQKTFNQYQKCTDIYSELWANGKTIEQLTVAV